MSVGAQAAVLPGERLHLHHGPIDLVIGVEGPARPFCYQAATDRFQTLLPGIVSDLPRLRNRLSETSRFTDPVAIRMAAAVRPHTAVFVTPMAAVAGAVADEVLAAMLASANPAKAYVNNGGDIAFYLSEDANFKALGPAGEITISSNDNVRGIATSGWRGRSHSRGIADAVTVLARTAAEADVAATLIANAVDLPGHPAITRRPAFQINPDSDLGDRLVTTDVGVLSPSEIQCALSAGMDMAKSMIGTGRISQAVLSLQGHCETNQTTPQIRAFSHA